MTEQREARRGLGRVIRAVANPNHYVALTRLGEYRRPFGDFVWRYVMSRGRYPHVCRMNTKSGPLDIHTSSAFDMFTISEIYSWRCYPIRGDERTVVDFGANIGISMGYFLGNLPQAKVYGFEPLERNYEAAARNLAPFEGRFELTRAAVWDHAGTVSFGAEPTGRYSGVGVAAATEEITVPCVRARDAIGRILEERGAIDLLKIDIEGGELRVLNDLTDEQLRAIRVVLVEGEDVPMARMAAAGMRKETFSSGIHRFSWPVGNTPPASSPAARTAP